MEVAGFGAASSASSSSAPWAISPTTKASIPSLPTPPTSDTSTDISAASTPANKPPQTENANSSCLMQSESDDDPESNKQLETELQDQMRTTSSPSPSPSPRASFRSLRTALTSLNSRLSASTLPLSPQDRVQVVEVLYPDAGPLYLDLNSRVDGCGAFVKGFRRSEDGSMGQAEASGQVHVNDMLYAINGQVLTDMAFQDIIQAAKTATFPCTLVFHSHGLPAAASPMQSPSGVAASSPVWGGSWSAKLGQIVAETSQRVASFEKKKDGSPSGTSTPPAGDGNKHRLWGDGTTLDKVKNSDGVKTLLRMMGSTRSRPEDDREIVASWLDHLELRWELARPDGDEQELLVPSFVVIASGSREIGVREEDQQEFALMWYRKTPTQELILIKGVHTGRYFPSVDDADATLSLRCESLRFANLVRVVESSQPFVLDAAVTTTVTVLLDAGAGAFSATLASNEHDSFQIKITADNVVVLKISEEEAEAGVVVDTAYHVHLQVLVDPTNPRRFTLKVREFGSILGTRPSHTCVVKNKQQLADVSCFILLAQNPQHRDILTLLIRRFRQQKLAEVEEEQARREEMNLFSDPASSPCLERDSTDEFSPRSNSSFIAPPDRFARSISDPATVMLSPSLTRRLSDMLGFDVEDPKQQDGRAEPATPAITDKATETAPSIAENGNFLQDRLLSQEKEIAMLQDKLASLSVLLKSTEHEKNEIRATLIVKDTRIESQLMRIQQAEKLSVQLAAQSRELQLVRSRLEEEVKLHASCQHDLSKALAASSITPERCDQSTQTDLEEDVYAAQRARLEAMTAERDDLQFRLQELEQHVHKLQDEHSVMQGERNSYRSKHLELARDVKRLVNTYGSLAEVESQLAERTNLTTQLAVARAEAKQATDEMQEYKDAAEMLTKQQAMADKEKGTQRLAAQNMELQRLVTQLTESLNDSREQVATVKKINAALVEKLQRTQPGAGASVFESPPMSPMSTSSSMAEPCFTSDDEDEDDNDEEDDDVRSIDQQFPQTVRAPPAVQMF